jgi:hypothetical protein
MGTVGRAVHSVCDIAQAKDFIAPPGYRRHRPEATLLYQLVAEHYGGFRDRPLPRALGAH